MRIAVFGGSFNPPHIGHVRAAEAALEALLPERLLIVPGAEPPHKQQAEFLNASARLSLAELAFSALPNTEISDVEQKRGGLSYTVDTLSALKEEQPEAELVLLIGTDMLETFESWRDYQRIFSLASLAVFPRAEGEREKIIALKARYEREYGAVIYETALVPMPVSSTEIRAELKERRGNNFLPDGVYREIIKWRYYGAKPNLDWLWQNAAPFLDEKRLPHVRGCEEEAVRLAKRWGADEGLAAEAGILHDLTKKLKAPEQLKLCEKYDIISDADEIPNYKLLHAKTGAAVARDLFGISHEVYGAISWHTTGRANMSLLEKITYIADYIEPNRSFEGVETLRRLAYEDLNLAMIEGLRMSIDDLERRGILPHISSVEAMDCLKKQVDGAK